MAVIETDAVVLRTIRYGEADAVLSLYTAERGRVSAIAKGLRKPTSRLAGRLQPGVWAHMTMQAGRRDMHTVRGASVVQAHAGLWVRGERLRAAGCVLEAAMRVLPEDEPDAEAFALLTRTLALLAAHEPPPVPPHLNPLVLGFGAKLLVVSGLLPRLGACASCGAPGPLVGFSSRLGGVVCPACALGADRLEEASRQALAELLGRPLREAGEACPPAAAPGVERVIGAVLREHLGVELRSQSPR
jgi:DNA repair protein RecO (recombination protein O)